MAHGDVGIGVEAALHPSRTVPASSRSRLRETFEFMGQLQDAGAELMMSYTAPFPGTLFYEKADDVFDSLKVDHLGAFR